MENKDKTQNRQRGNAMGIAGKIFLKVLPILLISYLVLYTIVLAIAVKSQQKRWYHTEGGPQDSLAYTPVEWDLLKHKAFLTSRIAMAASDSIGLSVNLTDSLVQLEMKGVVLRAVKFDRFYASKFFRGFPPQAYGKHFSSPFTIGKIEGSVVKEPIIVKKAPRDSIEAAQNIFHPDTTKARFVEWHLVVDSTLLISFVQSNRSYGKTDWPTFRYRLKTYLERFVSNNHDLLRFRLPIYYPEIVVFVSRDDAKSIYRALPPNGQLTIKI